MALTKKTAENSAKNTLEGRFFDPDGNWHRGVVVLDGDGNSFENFDAYFPYKVDADASPHFYGLQKADGAWIIIKETILAGDDTYEIAKGSSDIVTNWTNRTTLSYDIYENVF